MLEGLKEKFKHAFAIETPDFEFTEEHTRIVDKLADFLVKRGMTAPAIMFIKSSAPLNMIANQVLTFLKPFAGFIFNIEEYKIFTEMLEYRESFDFIVRRIEEAERRFGDKKTRENQDTTGK